jgi:hypothetical protein
VASKTGAIRAGKAFVELFADDSALRRTLGKVSGYIKSWGAGLQKIGAGFAGVGAAIVTPLAAAVGVFASMGDEIEKASGRTGVAVEALSELGYAAGQSGADLETLETGLKSMAKVIAAAASGSKSAIKTLADLGIEDEIFGASPDKQFALLADRVAGIADPTMRAAMAMKVFGKSGVNLLPMIAGGAAGIAALRAEAHALGLTMSTEDAKAAVAFGDALDRLKNQLRQIVFTVGSALAPILNEWLDKTRSAGKAAIDWAKANKSLIVTAGAIGVGMIAAGAAFAGVGLAVVALGAWIGGLSTILGVAASALAFILTPAGAMVAVLGSIAAAVGYSVVSALEWAAALGVVKGAWSGITAALASGDLETAGKIAFQALKVAWFELVHGMRVEWSKLNQDVAEVVTAAKGLILQDGGAGVAEQIAQGMADRKAMRNDLENERKKLEALVEAAKAAQHPADLPLGGIPAVSATVPTDLPDKAKKLKRRAGEEGTISSLSERMFALARANQNPELKSIAASSKAAAASLAKIERSKTVYSNS